MLETKFWQLSHLFLMNWEMIEKVSKPNTTWEESVSIHKFCQLFSLAISIAIITSDSYAIREDVWPKFYTKHATMSALWILNTPPQVDATLLAAPSLCCVLADINKEDAKWLQQWKEPWGDGLKLYTSWECWNLL
jgi:hypothetical protein